MIASRRKAHTARAMRHCASRAVYAMLQDEEIQFDMIDDLDRRVDRAVAIAMSTRTEKAAIELAALNRKGRRR